MSLKHRLASLICAAALPASAVYAEDQWLCSFTTECYETESCAETDYELSLGALGERFLLSDIAGERPMDEVAVMDMPDQRAFVSPILNMSTALLSLYPGGAAQYSVHAAGSPPFVVSYRGTCEVKP